MYTQLQQVRKVHSNASLREIHSRTMKAVERLKTCEAEVIRCLQEVDEKLVHRFIGYNSLFQYALKALALSASQASSYIAVARKAKQLPTLQAAIDSGELSVSKATRITSVIDERSQMKWVEMAMKLPRRELEKEVAAVSPRGVVHERARYLNSTTLEMQTPISEDGYKELERAREVLASEKGEPVNLEETILAAVRFYLKHKDPVRKAERAMARKAKAAQKKIEAEEVKLQNATAHPPVFHPGEQPRSKARPRSAALPISVRHEVNHRDQGRCQHRLPDGSLCGTGAWMDHHHVQPRSFGGADTASNLITLCRAHHQARH